MTNHSVSLDEFSVSDLANLQAQIDQKLKQKQVERRSAVKNQILTLLKEADLTLVELFPSLSDQKTGSKPEKKTVAVKYSDGTNHWTGRGRTPQWIKNHLESGRDLDSLKVAQ